MSNRSKRPPKTKSSIVYCDEKFNCSGERCEAAFDCVECGTKQCGSCEITLHSSRLDWHERRPIDRPDPNLLCQNTCEKRNYADVSCEECKLNLCNSCSERVHSKSRKKTHTRHPFTFTTRGTDFDSLTPPIEADAESVTSPLAAINLTPQRIDVDKEFTECMSEYFSTPMNSISNAVNDTGMSAIMEPVDVGVSSNGEPQHTTAQKPLESLKTGSKTKKSERSSQDVVKGKKHGQTNDIDEEIYGKCKAFLLADQDEKLQVPNEAAFVTALKCDDSSQVKVLSIFGNTGDGKSHTLNHTFFGGREIFHTSACQKSCTLGVWAAFDPVHNLVVIDTEGLLGISPNHNQRTRLLLKVLAISDIVIYRTKADRLHNDLFTFIGDASKAYTKHFTEELKAASKRCNLELPQSSLGPAVIVFHETQHTQVLGKDRRECPDNFLKARFAELEQDIGAFSSLQYVGTQTAEPPTDFRPLLLAVKVKLRDTSVRSPRRPQIIYRALKVLNEKFSGAIQKAHPASFPDQYFTCTTACMSCRNQCIETVNHEKDGVQHRCEDKCKYQDQYDNRVYLCKACHDNGREEVVVPKASGSRENNWLSLAKYAWSGYVLECRVCGVIYRSRQYWYGNEDPVKSVVRTEVRHIWPGDKRNLQGTHNAARRFIDGLQYVTDSIASVSAKPTKAVSMWLTDQIAPPYWVPNAQITNCKGCKQIFDSTQQIHHCRACGEGFCDTCSEKKRAVPERGWGLEPVRVCDACYDLTTSMSDNTKEYMAPSTYYTRSMTEDSGSSDQENTVMPRKLGEVIGSTVGAVASVVVNYPLDAIQDSARPAYWVPNHKIKKCAVCSELFGPKLSIHHCRACGQGVCNPCSANRRPVPSRGWDHDVRVCNACDQKAVGPL